MDLTSQPSVPAPAEEAFSAAELLPLLYAELRRLAAHCMASQPPEHTLQPTALVHDAWLKLGGSAGRWNDRNHFYRVAAEAMHRILIDAARRKDRLKRGGGWMRVELCDEEHPASATMEANAEVVEAIALLAAVDPRAAEVIKLRYFAGFTVKEAAAALGIAEATVKRDSDYGEAWLAREIRQMRTAADAGAA